MPRRLMLLTLLGLAGLLLYRQLGPQTSLAGEVIPRFLVWFGLCFYLQMAALWLASGIREHDWPLAAVIICFGILFRLCLLPQTEITDDDIHRYLWDGRVTAAGENPYRFSPQEVYDATSGASLAHYRPEDREALGRLVTLANQTPAVERNFLSINYPSVKTIYPPLSQAVFALAHFLGPEDFRVYKALLCLFELATMLLLWLALRALRAPIHWLLIHAWSPLAIKEFAATGHHDAIAVCMLALCLYLLVRDRGRWAAAGLAGGVLAKLFPLVLLPALLRRFGLIGCLLLAAVIAAGLWPFADAGIGGLSGLLTFGKQWQFNAGLFSLLAWASSPTVARLLCAVVLLSAAGCCLWRGAPQIDRLLDQLLGLLALLLLLSPVVDPWYLTWLLPLLVLRPCAPLVAWTGLVAIHYSWFIQLADQWWIRPAQYLPLYLYLAYWFWRRRAVQGTLCPAGARQP